MIPDTQTWLKFAARITPARRHEWLAAMSAELEAIPDEKEQRAFAFGCFKAALSDGLRSRRGLNYIARAVGALLIVMSCAIGIKLNLERGNAPIIFQPRACWLGYARFTS